MTASPSPPDVRAASRQVGRRGSALLLAPGLAYLLVFLVVPLSLVLVYAFFERGRFGGVVPTFTLDNFGRLLEPTFLRVLGESVLYAGLATVVALLLGYPTAYAISQLPPRWRTVALVAVVLPFWTNFLIRTYAWIVLLNREGLLNSALRQLGVTDEPVSLLYTPGAVVVGLVYAYLPLMVLPIYASVERLDRELLEAAANLGAGPARRFVSITLPLTLPGVIAGSIFVFVPSLGNFVVPELLGGGKTILIGNLIRDQFLKARDWPFGAAMAFSIVLLLVLLLLVQARVTRRYRTVPDE